MPQPLQSPFVYYGGKSRAAPLIWQALGNPPNTVEPFFGSGAVLLRRPDPPGLETVNDLCGFLCNVFRALQADPAAVAHWCEFPVDECHLHAVHTWLVTQRETFTARLMGDPDYYDAQVAGRWLWGVNAWIGSGWCSGNGPWQSVEDEAGHRQLVHLGDGGRGVHRQRVHLGGQSSGGTCYGSGVHSKKARDGGLSTWFAALQARLRYVRVCCGDWTRVLGPSVTWNHGVTGIVLDPPYQEEERANVYSIDTPGIAEDVRQWALAHGDNPLLRIALCGYETDMYTMPPTWEKVCWSTHGGYGNQGQGRGRANKTREVLWFSPACLKIAEQSGTQGRLF